MEDMHQPIALGIAILILLPRLTLPHLLPHLHPLLAHVPAVMAQVIARHAEVVDKCMTMEAPV